MWKFNVTTDAPDTFFSLSPQSVFARVEIGNQWLGGASALVVIKMANPWFRLYSEFATDPKVQMLSEADQRRYIMLLCLRCSNEDVTLHETEIAFQLRISETEWAQTKAVLIAKKLITEDGKPTAWDKRQFASDSSNSRVKAHRERKKRERNVTVTPPDTDTDTDIPPPTRETDFDSRTKFAMFEHWQPDEKSFAAVLARNCLANQVFDQDQFLEFKSFWIASPDDHRTQAKWEHALAQHLKRGMRNEQANGRNANATQQPASRNAQDHQGEGAAGRNQRPARTGSLSAPDRVRAAIAERDAAAGATRQAMDQNG
ncbi:MAG TPA: DnaT-like ssDNA-binding domain-containing protein [Pseudomonas sp.]|uniref:DnaT-like ssDNA-binding domain-containing protein n=1 Tax=Pseudomonas sp. TaxID=306 RepID=UPI002CCB9C28|nr:DnaT-like ssDNA-binding domain-containing protein [Pseudomonas sp.]HWH86177.1 DnaT-like ssDNA-binding domain-containing protein [Pseudomonas sp.]